MRRFALLSALVAALALSTAGSAFATHTHARVVGNGQCVVIAENAGEENVVLPGAVFEHNPYAEAQPAGRQHPLHVLVHLGRAGEVGSLFVYESAAGNAACAAGYVNRP